MTTEEKIVEIIGKIRPYLNNDGGDIEFVKFEDGIVYVSLMGACEGCQAQDSTLKDGIEALLLEEVEGVIEVRNISSIEE